MLNLSAPKFTLEANTGQKIQLEDLLGAFTVLVFYPMNDTPICNRQLGDINLRLSELIQHNTRVFGVNAAGKDKHKEYCVRKRLEFPILSDPDGVTAKSYNAWMRWFPIAKRTVVVIDPTGTIRYYKRGAPSLDEILDVIKSQQNTSPLEAR
jgi:peroxiredoxin Q/BCP